MNRSSPKANRKITSLRPAPKALPEGATASARFDERGCRKSDRTSDLAPEAGLEGRDKIPPPAIAGIQSFHSVHGAKRRRSRSGSQVPIFHASPEGDLPPYTHLPRTSRGCALWNDEARGRKPFARLERFPSPEDPCSTWVCARMSARAKWHNHRFLVSIQVLNQVVTGDYGACFS